MKRELLYKHKVVHTIHAIKKQLSTFISELPRQGNVPIQIAAHRSDIP